MEFKTDYYKEIFNDFLDRHPYFKDEVNSYRPKHTNAIRIIFKDGRMMDYNIRTHTYRDVCEYRDSNPDDITDDNCREIFSANLIEQMKMRGFDQPDLAARTGLSCTIISKYMRKQATPSITNLEKIAHALNCSRDELLE